MVNTDRFQSNLFSSSFHIACLAWDCIWGRMAAADADGRADSLGFTIATLIHTLECVGSLGGMWRVQQDNSTWELMDGSKRCS